MRNAVVINNNNEKYRIINGIRELKINNLIKEIKDVSGLLPSEIRQFYYLVNAINVEGDMVEFGVHRGGSSKIICECKLDKTLHLFDTFKGIPKEDWKDSQVFKVGDFSNTSIEEVRNYLKDYSNVRFYVGKFSKTKDKIKDLKFSFIHLDADLYSSTLEALKFFYPKMNKGAVLLCHNYQDLLGVQKAFKEFFINKKEIIIELNTTQCLFIKQD